MNNKSIILGTAFALLLTFSPIESFSAEQSDEPTLTTVSVYILQDNTNQEFPILVIFQQKKLITILKNY